MIYTYITKAFHPNPHVKGKQHTPMPHACSYKIQYNHLQSCTRVFRSLVNICEVTYIIY